MNSSINRFQAAAASTDHSSVMSNVSHVTTDMWIVMEALTVALFLTIVYIFVCFLRYGQITGKFERSTTTANSRNTGQTNLYRIALAIVSLCLPLIVLTQIDLIVVAITTHASDSDNSTVCNFTVVFRFVLEAYSVALSHVYVWYCQRLFYERAAIQHLRTRVYSFFSWLSLIFPTLFTTAIFLRFIFTVDIYDSENGCVFKALQVFTADRAIVVSGAVFSICLKMGLFLYPLYATKSSKPQVENESIAKTAVHRIIKRYIACAILFIVFSPIVKTVTNVLLTGRLCYVWYVIYDAVHVIECVAVTQCLAERRKILLWWAV